MLSERDRRTLADIERHLQDDPGLYQAFRRRTRQMSGVRRTWWVLLLVALALVLGLAALGVEGPAVECAALAAVIGVGLRLTQQKPDSRRAGRRRA